MLTIFIIFASMIKKFFPSKSAISSKILNNSNSYSKKIRKVTLLNAPNTTIKANSQYVPENILPSKNGV